MQNGVDACVWWIQWRKMLNAGVRLVDVISMCTVLPRNCRNRVNAGPRCRTTHGSRCTTHDARCCGVYDKYGKGVCYIFLYLYIICFNFMFSNNMLYFIYIRNSEQVDWTSTLETFYRSRIYIYFYLAGDEEGIYYFLLIHLVESFAVIITSII